MADSSVPSGKDRERPNGPRTPASSGGQSRRPSRPAAERGERKPYARGDGGERKPYERRDGKPGERGERKPYARGEGGERKPYERRDGKPGERGERKPYARGEGSERKPYERRDGKPGERSAGKPWLDRDGKPQRKRAGDARPDSASRGPRREREDRPPRREWDDSKPRHNDPVLPDSIVAKDLEKSAYAELKGLSKENAERVARYLVAAAVALEADAALAHSYALAAARTAGRVAVVRETVAITAYETGDFALALRELRTFRRLSGKNDHIALIVDSERGLGRPEKALEEGRAVDRDSLPVESRVALAIALSGARLDMNQPELALGELEIPELKPDRAFSYSPMLFHAYAEVLEELGRAKESAEWRRRAEVAQAALDEEFRDDVIEVFEEIDDAVLDLLDANESDTARELNRAAGELDDSGAAGAAGESTEH